MEQIVLRKADVTNSNTSAPRLLTAPGGPVAGGHMWSGQGPRFPFALWPRGSHIETFSPRQCEQKKGAPSQAGTASCWQNRPDRAAAPSCPAPQASWVGGLGGLQWLGQSTPPQNIPEHPLCLRHKRMMQGIPCWMPCNLQALHVSCNNSDPSKSMF